MIKFFRKIRQSHLSEGKTGKYLKYAVGEIILVVIGILIALSINNWNQERIKTKQTVDLLNNMISDLKADITGLNRDIKRYEKSISNGKIILNTENFDSISADSLYFLLPTKVVTYRVTTQAFEKIKNLGISKILDSNNLFNAISSYYTSNLFYLENVIKWEYDSSIKSFEFWTLNNQFESAVFAGIEFIPYSDEEAVRKNALIKFVSSIESRNHIRQAISKKNRIVKTLKSTKTDAETLISLIEDELNKK
jgi:hypothetical protein